VFVVVTLAILVGLALILLMNRSTTPVAAERAYYQPRGAEQQRLERLAPEQFERLCIRLLEEMGLIINSFNSNRKGRIDITAANPQPITGGDYIVHCVMAPANEPIDSTQIVALSDTVRAEGAAKGIFITTGFFSEEVPKLIEGPPLELINGHRLRQILSERRIPFV
jgi:restriction endonuclease Mrr